MLTRFSTDAFNSASLTVVSDALERIRTLASAPLSEHDRLAIRDLAETLHRRLAALASGVRTGEAQAPAVTAADDARRAALRREDARLDFI